MAKDEKEMPDGQKEAQAEAVLTDTEGLVKIFKDGVTLFVHPTCVKNHQELGWKAVE